ncbi:MAG: GNAT family N-acetyltransferase [Elusimicrobia bacterium]|nr:GNAT family N-acetyltransferase [Elusimicrobiota bacterium]
MEDLRARVSWGLDGILSLRKQWEKIFAGNDSLSIFSSPQWHLAWWTSMGVGRKACALVAEKGSEVIGILPLCIYRASWDELKLRILELSGGSQNDCQDIIAAQGEQQRVMEAFAEVFAGLCRKVDIVRLRNISAGSVLSQWLLRNEKGAYISEDPLPFLPLTGRVYSELEKSWSTSHRGDLRRQRRRLEALAALSLQTENDEQQIMRRLPDFFAALKARWAGQGFSATRALSLRHRRLFAELTRTMAPLGQIHFSVLKLNNDPISYHFGFFANGVLYWYRPTYEIKYQNYSPGKVHIAMLLELGCQSGWSGFDFLLGAEPYKYLWTDQKRTVKTFIFKGGGLFSHIGLPWVTRGRRMLLNKFRVLAGRQRN